ncbi:MAG TPA: phosphoribosylglycinamide formyltransferase [Patescibacteria group bacterium]|nr:phosphoribosylglycinamide formyltransferase [Patescibacteria group bacterium]
MKRRINVAVLASGRGSNFEALAEACLDETFPAAVILLIVDNPDAGALRIAERMGVESVVIDCGPQRGSMSPESSGRMHAICTERGIDLVCLAGFMRIVKGKLLESYGGRMLNIHPALLPSFKGLHGQRQAVEYGVKFSGCTVHFVDAGVDTGPIIVQHVVPVRPDDDEESLGARILREEHTAYPEAVRLFAEGRLRIEGRTVHVLNGS